jgi:hypothetical protein
VRIERIENLENNDAKIKIAENGVMVVITVSGNNIEVFSNHSINVSPQRALNKLLIDIDRRSIQRFQPN